MAIDPARAARLAKQSATLAVKYGPQAKLAWDNGGRKAADAAAARVALVRARRRAFAEADGVKDGSVLAIAPGGATAYVVFSGADAVAVHPPTPTPMADLLAHADLDRRVTPTDERARRVARRQRLTRRGRPGSPGPAGPPGLPDPGR